VLGQFQRIVFAELDGPRPRSIRMQFMGERAVCEPYERGESRGAPLPPNGGLQ
jgi:hypothetical protein